MNIQSMMMQAQKMQKELAKKNAEFEAQIFDFEYQNKAITIQISGKLEIKKISIIDDLIDIDDKITLEEMVAEAINYAIGEVSSKKSSNMPKGMPGLF